MKALVIGLGIGQLYVDQFKILNYQVTTVDPNKPSDYSDIADVKGHYDIAVIATPNYLHYGVSRQAAKLCDIVLVEKPGVADHMEWQKLCEEYPHTRFMMVKNNQWRANIQELLIYNDLAQEVSIDWLTRNRIPYPGSHFTNRKLSFGGVSRDIMPHLLSLYCLLNPDYKQQPISSKTFEQRHQLVDIKSTDYGTIDYQGIYDVDDYAQLTYGKYFLTANWADNQIKQSITFRYADRSELSIELGFCPNEAYLNMIRDCVSNKHNDEFWHGHLDMDTWIHQQLC